MTFLKTPNNDWLPIIKKYNDINYLKKLDKFIALEYKNNPILPKSNEIFNALKLTPYNNVKVVILGQDPYPDALKAMGLSFSVNPHTGIPGSLMNIFKERQSDLNIPITNNGDLTHWAKQGVLLLNTALTVNLNKKDEVTRQWFPFTDNIIKALNEKAKTDPIVFILWGNNAKEKLKLIDTKNPNIYIIQSSHPSQRSAHISFFGSKPFSKANNFLKAKNVTPIDWTN